MMLIEAVRTLGLGLNLKKIARTSDIASADQGLDV